MLGRVAYGQTQYAHTGSSSKWKSFQEFLKIAEEKVFAIRSSWQDMLIVVDSFWKKSAVSKFFKEAIKVFDSLGRSISSLLKDFIVVLDQTVSRQLVVLMEALKVKDLLSSSAYYVKLFIEKIGLFFSFQFSLKKLYQSFIAVLDNSTRFISGISLTEILKVKEAFRRNMGVIFKSFLKTLDQISLQLNGFLVRWQKQKTVHVPVWVKRESPTTIWEKKQRRSVED